MRFSIFGDSSGLVSALNEAGDSLNRFGSQTSGIASTVAGNMSGMIGSLTSLNPAMLGAAAAAGVLGIAFATLGTQTEAAMEVYQASVLSGMSPDKLQQQAQAFRQVGLTLENVADQNKDLKDKLQDALYNNGGSMMTDVIAPLKLNIVELQNMASAGEDVYAKIYFAAKAQGMSAQSLFNMFETVGSDSVRRLEVLRTFNSEQEYQKSLQEQTIALSNEQVEQFRRYEGATSKLSMEWQKWKNDSVAPLAESLAEVLELINKITNSKPVQNAAYASSDAAIKDLKQWQQQQDDTVTKNSSIYGAQIIADKQEKNNKEALAHLENLVKQAEAGQKAMRTPLPNEKYLHNPLATDKKTIDSAMQPLQGNKQKAEAELALLTSRYGQLKASIDASLLSAYGGDTAKQKAALKVLEENYKEQKEGIDKKINADAITAQKASDQKAKQDAATAKQAAAQAKQEAAQQIATRKQLASTMSQIGESEAAVKLQRWKFQYDEMERTTKEAAAKLGMTEQESSELLKRQYAGRTQAYREMVDQMLKESDRKKLAENLSVVGSSLDQTQKKDLLSSMNKEAGIDRDDSNPWDSRGLETDLAELAEKNTQELALNDQLLASKILSHEQFLERKKQLEDKYQQDSTALMVNQTTAQLTMMGSLASSTGTLLSAAFGKQSAAARTAFAISKGLAVAESIIAIQQSVAKAMALGWPMGIAAGVQAVAQGAQIINTIKGTTIQGQAHDGIDSVPNSGTWNLQKGERVVGAALNADLTKYLKDDNGSTQGDTNITAPLIVNGSGNLTESDFPRLLMKYKETLVQAVRQSQQRNS